MNEKTKKKQRQLEQLFFDARKNALTEKEISNFCSHFFENATKIIIMMMMMMDHHFWYDFCKDNQNNN